MEEQEKSILADLNKLLDFGFLKEEHVIKTPNGDFRFVLETISPLEEAQAYQRMEKISGDSEVARNTNIIIELLARSIKTVNDVPLEDHPYASKFVGQVPLDRKREVVAKFSEKLLLPLWTKYETLKNKTGVTQADEEVKK